MIIYVRARVCMCDLQ